MRVVVVGIANQQTALPIGSFPVEYEAARYLPNQIRHTVGGVGFNVARTLSTFGNMVALASPLGEDYPAAMVDSEAYRFNISTHLCRRELLRTPRSLVLYASEGRRQVNVDIGDAVDFVFQETHLAPDLFRAKLGVLGNLDMVRPLIDPVTRRGRRLAVDLQDVRGPDNPYDEEFLKADFLTMSNEYVQGSEQEILLAFRAKSRARVLTMTLAHDGALVLTRDMDAPVHVPAPMIEPRNSAGAGDIAFATFLHAMVKLKEDPVAAVERGVKAASRHVATEVAKGPQSLAQMREILGVEPEPDSVPSVPEFPWTPDTYEI